MKPRFPRSTSADSEERRRRAVQFLPANDLTILAADLHLVRLRGPVLGRPALYDVTDINIGSFQGNPFFRSRILDHLRQKLAGSAHKRNPLLVFVGARSFPHEYELRLLVTRPE